MTFHAQLNCFPTTCNKLTYKEKNITAENYAIIFLRYALLYSKKTRLQCNGLFATAAAIFISLPKFCMICIVPRHRSQCINKETACMIFRPFDFTTSNPIGQFPEKGWGLKDKKIEILLIKKMPWWYAKLLKACLAADFIHAKIFSAHSFQLQPAAALRRRMKSKKSGRDHFRHICIYDTG